MNMRMQARRLEHMCKHNYSYELHGAVSGECFDLQEQKSELRA